MGEYRTRRQLIADAEALREMNARLNAREEAQRYEARRERDRAEALREERDEAYEDSRRSQDRVVRLIAANEALREALRELLDAFESRGMERGKLKALLARCAALSERSKDG